MQSNEAKCMVMMRLFSDEDLVQSLKEVCRLHKVESAIVISGIGQLKDIELGYFKEKGNYTPQKFEGTWELLNLTGNIQFHDGDYYVHCHAVIGDIHKQVVGGHLISATVQFTNEIALMKAFNPMRRELNESLGQMELCLDKKEPSQG